MRRSTLAAKLLLLAIAATAVGLFGDDLRSFIRRALGNADPGFPKSSSPSKARFEGDGSPFTARVLLLECSDGTVLSKPAGTGHMWRELARNADSSVVYTLRSRGDASGSGPPLTVHRFDEQRASATWIESIVLRDADLSRSFPKGTHLMDIDRVSTDGRTILIGTNGPDPSPLGNKRYSRQMHHRFDTVTGKSSSPFGPPRGGVESTRSRPKELASAEIVGDSIFGKALRLECSDGRVLEKPAGDGHVWMDLITNEDSTIAYVLRCRGDERGLSAEDLHRFHAPSDAAGWVETVVLRRSDLAQTFSANARLGSLDQVSPDGRTLLIFVSYFEPEFEARIPTEEGSYSIDVGFRRHSFLFDTESQGFSSPLDD